MEGRSQGHNKRSTEDSRDLPRKAEKMNTNFKTKVQPGRERGGGLLFEPGSKQVVADWGDSAERLRTLEGLEEFFWLSENTNPHPVVTIAEVEGRTMVGEWRRALGAVRERYPLLSVRIRKEPGE